jgi:L-amino acid N-acyltransferase YncA
MTEVAVRALAEADWDEVRAVYRQGMDTGEATFETEVPPRPELDATWLPGHRWVAELDGRVAGWATLAPVSARPCYAGVAESSVYVAAAARGRGVGALLLRRQVAEADAAGLWTLQAAIFATNAASVALFHRGGFRTVGRRERIARRDGAWRDTLLLERRGPDPVDPARGAPPGSGG